MRMMLRVKVPVEAGNRAIADGSLEVTIGSVMENLKPEAAYFMPDGGQRTALFFFDMTDASDIPPSVERLFQDLNASVELTPAMNLDDLQTGLGKLS